MIALDGSPLSIGEVVRVARGGEDVSIAPAAIARMRPAADLVERIDTEDRVVYGVTTGFGALADRTISSGDRATLQRSLILSHAAGAGPPVDTEIVRGMLLLRARTLCTGFSGVRPLIPEAVAGLLNAGIVPEVPEHGSLGASGDLAPLAHAAAVLLGEGHARDRLGRRVDGGDALAAAGLTPVVPAAKEGLALINGTDAMTAVLALALHDLRHLLTFADCAAAMSIEALLGTTAPFDAEVVALRRAAGPAMAAENLRRLLEGSAIVASHRDSHHAVQDAYSLRCTPQVHGAARDLAEFAAATIDRELASVVDNPVVMVERAEVISTGNFHGQALAYAADCCAMVCADIAALSERRIDRLLDPARSRGLPAFLVRDPGRNSGLMIAQYTAAALVAELRHAATPLSVHSAATSAGQEDHVSMGFVAALRTRRSVERLQHVLALEALCAGQAQDLRAPLAAAPATAALLGSLREHVAGLEHDRFLGDDIGAAGAWVAGGTWRHAAQATAGELL